MRKTDRFFDAAYRGLKYAMSLPERTIRSLAALAGGTSRLLVETLFPESLRRSTTYRVTLGMMQQFIIEQVAGMENEISADQDQLGEDFLQRKLAGNAIEAAGLLTMGASPLWVFAFAGDAAGGGKMYLNRLIRHLKANGVIDEEAQATNLVDVLEAIQSASVKSATMVDTPPLSREALSGLVDEMADSYARVFRSTSRFIPRIDALWKKMEGIARRENVSLERLVGMMTIDAATWSKKGAGAVKSTGAAGVELFDEKILDSYRQTLDKALDRGVNNYMLDQMRPFLDSAVGHFDPERKTWTESRMEKRVRPSPRESASDDLPGGRRTFDS
jgi:hypothetical protein